MPINEKNTEVVKSCLTSNYLPAMLREHKSGWIIEYYAEKPLSKKLERKNMKLTRVTSRYKSVKDARLHANRMVMALNIRLSTGWNPFFTSEDARLYATVDTVCNAFISEKSKELRKASICCYKSFTVMFANWLKKNTNTEYLSMVNKTIVSQYLDYVYNERNVSVRAYNNYLKLGRCFFNWAKEKCYVKENPFDLIKLKPKQQKKRTIIPHEYREIIANYLLSHPEEKNYLLALKLIYGAMLRPAEIVKIKIENIDLTNGVIIVPAEVSKNKKQRIIPMTDAIRMDFEQLNLFNFPKSYYVLGRGFVPNSQMLLTAYMRCRWDKIRKKLNLPKEMQQYSLRDTGIFEMLKSGIDQLTVMQHADHHSLEMTTIYANHVDPNLATIIREKSPTF
jgi:integrase